jgi:hypothetical protein
MHESTRLLDRARPSVIQVAEFIGACNAARGAIFSSSSRRTTRRVRRRCLSAARGMVDAAVQKSKSFCSFVPGAAGS